MVRSEYKVLKEAIKHLKNSNLDTAKWLLEKLLEIDSNNYRARFLLGKVHLMYREEVKAEKEFLKILKYNPNNSYALVELGKMYIREGNFQKSKKILKSVKNKTKEENIFLTYELAYIYFLEHNFSEAKRLLNQILTQGNKNNALFLLAKILFLEEDLVSVKRILSSLINNSDHFKRVQWLLIYIDILEGKYGDAFLKLGKVSNKDRDYDFVYIYLKSKLNMIETSLSNSSLSYSGSQIVSYNKNKAIEHIVKHKEENNKKEKHSVLSPDVDVKEIINNIENKSLKLIGRNIFDTYIMRFPNAGRNYLGEKTNYLKIITVIGTKNVITMFPYANTDFELDLDMEKEKMQYEFLLRKKF